MSRTNAERSATTRAKLLDATLELLIERGYPKTSVAAVSARAGVSKGAQLHHFPNRATLVAAAVERLLARRREEFEALMAALPPGADRVDVAFEELWRIYSGPTLGAWMELVVAARTDPGLRAAVGRVNESFARDAEAGFQAVFGEVDPALLPAGTRLILALFDGLATTHFLEDATDVEATLTLFKQLLLTWRASLGATP